MFADFTVQAVSGTPEQARRNSRISGSRSSWAFLPRRSVAPRPRTIRLSCTGCDVMLSLDRMTSASRSSHRLAAHARRVVVVSYLALFAVVAPLLVLCEEGNRHATIELAISFCCQRATGVAGGSSHVAEPRLAEGRACADSCVDTPYLTGTDVVATGQMAHARHAVTVDLPVVPAVVPQLPSPRDAAWWSPTVRADLRTTTVLRI